VLSSPPMEPGYYSKRPLWVELRWRLLGVRRFLVKFVPWFLTRLLAAAFVLFVALVAYHWYSGADVDYAVRMAVNDYKVLVRCPHEGKYVLAFVRRPPDLFILAPETDRVLAGDWPKDVCQGRYPP